MKGSRKKLRKSVLDAKKMWTLASMTGVRVPSGCCITLTTVRGSDLGVEPAARPLGNLTFSVSAYQRLSGKHFD
ncbi:hypothetical protein MBOT_19430 [Mycobacterium botniense]|uniref:Uncharacterized protein n=1 Tax=Mycobacterium botniense TaxID=84962 RepID=A0A7I9XXS6_9MYCO|nr:hypothetical protein MBOT_19430 [Mycobacterium botniense]